MRADLLKVIDKYSPQILEQWADRNEKLLPNWDADRVKSLVKQLLVIVKVYLKDERIDKPIEQTEMLVNRFFLALNEAPTLIINSLLISRYIFLSAMAKYSSPPINSLDTFGQLNDLIDPLIRGIHAHFISKTKSNLETLPSDFTRAQETSLLSVDFAGIGIYMLDRNFNIIFWNQGMEKLFDISTREVLGKNLVVEFPNLKNEKKVYHALLECVHRGKEVELYEIKHPIGNEPAPRILNYKMSSLKDKDGDIIGVSVLMNDITEHHISKSELRRFEQYFENILNDAADAIILLNENDRVVMWNKAAELMYGWKEEEMIGKSIKLIVPDDMEAQQEIEWIGEQVRKSDFVRNLRAQRITRDGRQLVVNVTRTAIRNEHNEFIGSSAIARDITQEEQLRQQLVQSEKLSAVGTLAAGIAHEVGAPLTSISSLAQVLKEQTGDQFFKDKIDLIQQYIDRLSRTVRTLVDFSKPIIQKIEKVYLNEIVDNAIRIIKYDRRLKKQQIETKLYPQLTVVKASFDQLLQVFVNICLNAADAMESCDRRAGLLQIETWEKGDMVYASICDNGCGISAENIDKIFEPFFTTKSSDKGTGLGLWVSYNIIKGFRGDIKVTSEEKNGTTFTISLPKYY